MAMATPDEDHGTSIFKLAYFFIPLPEFIAVPNEWHCQLLIADNDFLHHSPSPPTLFGEQQGTRVELSIILRQVQTAIPVDAIVLALNVAAGAFGWADAVAGNPVANGPQLTRTVAEVMVPVNESTIDRLEAPFEQAVKGIEAIQRAYYGVSQHAVPVLTASRLPPVIPYAIRMARVGEQAPTWPRRDDVSFFINFRSELSRTQPMPLPPEKVQAMGAIHAATSAGPFGHLLDLRREFALAQSSGGTVPAAILCGAAAEVLFRELLLLLMWEEGREPAEARNVAATTNISTLVFRQFHPRLGGSWTSDGQGPIAAWFQQIARLRNRAVHVGYAPTGDEIERAKGTYARLERFVGDRLAASVQHYPLTTRTFLGDAGIKARRVEAQLSRRLEPDLYPTDLPGVFRRWRMEVQRHAEDGPWVGDAERSEPTLIHYANGRLCWWAVDNQSGLACLAAVPSMTQSQLDNLDRLRDELQTQKLEQHVAVRVIGSATPLELQPHWQPLFEVLPDNSISRYALSLLPPPISI